MPRTQRPSPRRLWQEIRACFDFAVLGRFNQAQPSSLPLRTSRNQVLRLFCDRYSPANFSEELTEFNIKEGGRVEVTGFPTLGLPWKWPFVIQLAFFRNRNNLTGIPGGGKVSSVPLKSMVRAIPCYFESRTLASSDIR